MGAAAAAWAASCSAPQLVLQFALLLRQVAGLVGLLLVRQPRRRLRLRVAGLRLLRHVRRLGRQLLRQSLQRVGRLVLLLLRLRGVVVFQRLLGLVHRLVGLLQRLLLLAGRQLRRLFVQILLLLRDLGQRLLHGLLAGFARLLVLLVARLLRLLGELPLVLGQLLRRLPRRVGRLGGLGPVLLRVLRVGGLLLAEILRQLVGGVGRLGQRVFGVGWRVGLVERLRGVVHLRGGVLVSVGRAFRIKTIQLMGDFRLPVGVLLRRVRIGLTGFGVGRVLRQIALFVGQLVGLGGVAVAAGHFVGQVVQGVGRLALGLGLVLRRGVLRLLQSLLRPLLFGLRLGAGVQLFGLVGHLLLLLLRRRRLRRVRLLLGVVPRLRRGLRLMLRQPLARAASDS